jgi:outer membrane protein TolC
MLCGSAHAEVLPWIGKRIADPFAMGKKAAGLVSPDLKTDSCALPDFKHKLTYSDVVIASLCNNPDAKGAYLNLLSQTMSFATSYAGYLPSATASLNRSKSTSFVPGSISTTFGRTNDVSASILLYDFGQRELKLEIAELTLIAAGYGYNSALQGMIASALQGYYRLLTSQNAVDIAKESERFAKESYDAAKLRHKIGQVPRADELQAKGAYSQALLSSEQAVNQLTLDQAALDLLMGIPPDVAVEVAEVDKNLVEKDPFGGNVQRLMAEAKSKRYDLQASRVQFKGAEESLRSLKRSDLATISATAGTDLNNIQPNVFGRTANRSQTIGVSVNIPIFTGFSQTYSERAAEKQLDAQREGLVKSELGVEQDVWNAWHNYQTSKLSWETSKDLLESSTQLKDVALGRYKEGLGTILDVLSAQSQYSSALQSQLQSRYNLLTTRIDLIRAVGMLNLNTMDPKGMLHVAATDEVRTHE